MAQQAIKFIQNGDGTYTATIVADAVTSLDAGEDFRLVVEDTLTESEIHDRVQQLITTLRDGQEVLDAALL